MDRRLKVLVHCVYFPPEVGGLESHVHYLCRGLVERGHAVTVVTSRSRPELPEEEEMDGMLVLRTPLPSRTPLGWFAHAAGSTRRTREAAQNADVAHAQAFPSILPCALALAGRSTPLVATLHTSHFLRLAARRLTAPPLGKLIEFSDHNFAASKEIADVGRSLGSSIDVEVLVNGVETDFFRPGAAFATAVDAPATAGDMPATVGDTPGTEPAVGTAPASRDMAGPSGRRLVVPRRLFPKNGVEFFVRAMPLIAERADVTAMVIGDGPERTRLEGLAVELGVGDRIKFLGARPHAEMPKLLSGDLAVFPSLVEATSVAALECMACGLPVAASAVGGLPEIVDDAVGGLFPPGNAQAMADKVLELLSDPRLRERGVTARKRVVAQWSNARLVERHLEVYRSLLECRRG